MHDMRFAMAMNSGPMAQDNFLGPYGMIQVVRRGIATRGAAAAGDEAVLQLMDAVTHVPSGAGRGVFGVALDDAPVTPVPGDPKKPEGDAPKATQPTTPSTAPTKPPGWFVTEAWEAFIKDLPDLPTPTDVTSARACHVKKFEYPVPDSFVGDPEDGQRGPETPPGFKFEAMIEYDPNPPYACECCVFRQWLQKYKDGAVSKALHRDNTAAGGREYGGSREDGSNGSTPDNPDKESTATMESSPCLLYFEDNPGEGGTPGAGYWDIRYDFIGVVFDRCNKWKPVAVKRMIMERKTTYQYEGGDPQKDRAPDLVVRDKPDGKPKVTPGEGPPK